MGFFDFNFYQNQNVPEGIWFRIDIEMRWMEIAFFKNQKIAR